MITRKPEHLKTFDYLGPHRYFLTFCTFERRHIFLTRERTDAVLGQFLRAAIDEGFAVLAYCFMPDHVHLLVEGQATDSDCRRFIARAKQLSAFHVRNMFGLRLWQRYGFERTLRSDESTLTVARYILENPVRAVSSNGFRIIRSLDQVRIASTQYSKRPSGGPSKAGH